MSDEPLCSKCGKVMTRENAKIHPEYFLHDECLPLLLQLQAEWSCPKLCDPKTCKHESFECNVTVNRFEDVNRFMADVTVKCVQCGESFRFIRLPAGLDFNSPCVSVDGCEGRFPIHPKGESLSELEGSPQGFTARRTQ